MWMIVENNTQRNFKQLNYQTNPYSERLKRDRNRKLIT